MAQMFSLPPLNKLTQIEQKKKKNLLICIWSEVTVHGAALGGTRMHGTPRGGHMGLTREGMESLFALPS